MRFQLYQEKYLSALAEQGEISQFLRDAMDGVTEDLSQKRVEIRELELEMRVLQELRRRHLKY